MFEAGGEAVVSLSLGLLEVLVGLPRLLPSPVEVLLRLHLPLPHSVQPEHNNKKGANQRKAQPAITDIGKSIILRIKKGTLNRWK